MKIVRGVLIGVKYLIFIIINSGNYSILGVELLHSLIRLPVSLGQQCQFHFQFKFLEFPIFTNKKHIL